MLTRSRGLGGSPAVYGQPAPRSYDSRASGGSLYPHTAGARGKHGGTSHKKRSEIHEKHKFAFGSHQLQRRAGLRSGRLSRPREMQGLPGQGLRHGERQGHPAQFVQARLNQARILPLPRLHSRPGRKGRHTHAEAALPRICGGAGLEHCA